MVELPDDDAALMKISSDGILSLSLEEMRAIRNHYLQQDVQAHRAEMGLPAWPTDIELEESRAPRRPAGATADHSSPSAAIPGWSRA